MKKFLLFFFITVIFLFKISTYNTVVGQQTLPALSYLDIPITCGCPSELEAIYQERINKDGTHDHCIPSQRGEIDQEAYDEFKKDPIRNHLWIEDPEITAQGKADDRARQFIYWVVTHTSVDNHPVLLKVWQTARNVSYFFVVLVAAIMGLGMIINQRSNFSSQIKVWPSIMKILLILLYITFSASLVITIIQLSDILMKFFIENLGGKDLFNIYFASVSQEKNYLDFVGCRDLNIRVQEAYKAEMIILKLTNVSYYVMGGMLILRKVLLWFLLFVSPFLAILMPFIFIRNIGWIWIGVFFQWLFYGPLFALFLGALATIWKTGIPFIFDFSRVNTTVGYIYPSAINILYGGPAQHLEWATNNGNYADTFAEYVITLIMLWAVTFFPWWLLRIFRDYCCEGINAMKNILMSMYDQTRGTPPTPPGPTPTPATIGTALKIPREAEMPIKVKLETVEEIKKAKTEEITRSLNITASKLTDIAHFETNKQVNETVRKNIDYLQNPIKAETTTDRQKYMNIRTELFNRAVKNDQVAKQVLSSISTSKLEQGQKRQEILQSISKIVPTTKLVTIKVAVPGEKIKEEVKAPEKPIEQTIAVPPTVSIEDYEQVKKMWKQQYEKGEVPVTENVKSRAQWVEQDIVFITNTLNKLLSPNDELKQQGLDDVGFILPIFLLNNLKGEELVVYLKAKVEAARAVKEAFDKEKEITEKLKAQAPEEFVEVAKPKEKKAEKTMEMKEEMKIDETKSNEEKRPEAS